MCGRFTLTWEEWRQIVDSLGVEDDGHTFADYRPRFNIAPTDQHFIITSEFERRKARRARWGLVVVGRRTTAAPANASTRRPKRLKSGQHSARRSSSAVAWFPPMASMSGPVPRANVSRSGYIRATAA
jgi:putative SOS response-associated peptidase YedK